MTEHSSFEGSVERLEGIVRQLESEGTSLNESLQLFEEGIRLSRVCSQRLDEAEQKILILVEDREGELSTVESVEGKEGAEE